MSIFEEHIRHLRENMALLRKMIRISEEAPAGGHFKSGSIDKTVEWIAEDKCTLAIWEKRIAQYEEDGSV
jgi:hypothetical protein